MTKTGLCSFMTKVDLSDAIRESNACVAGVTKMGNSVHRAGLEPTSGILSQCATIALHRLP